MLKKWLDYLNYGITSVILVLFLYALFLEWKRPNEIYIPEVKVQKTSLPKKNFTLSKELYDHIGEPLLSLQHRTPRMQLPDLKTKINYYGQNNRPDASDHSSLMHFNLVSGENASIEAGKPLYLYYRKDSGNYYFSPGNKETTLWIEASPKDNEVNISVKMMGEDGSLVATPHANATFSLKEKEFARYGGQPWEIGKWKVDGTLLARQRARWFGVDKFFERHGGQEYQEKIGKNRIDFGDVDDKYSVFVGENSALIWDGTKWKEVLPGESSRGHPLMLVKKIDERIMNLELWDADGKKKMTLNLLKSMDAWMPQNLQQQFKFLGARTKSQYVFEVGEEKMLLSPYDWLLLTEEGWRKLDNIDGINNYVDLKEIGTLFVFEGINKIGDQQVLKGEMFNPTRTKVHDMELPVLKDGLVYQQINKDPKRKINPPQKSNLQYVNGNQLDKKLKEELTKIKR